MRGQRTWDFNPSPVIAGIGTVVGPFEGKGPLADRFDLIHADTYLGQDSWEKAERVFFEEACDRALEKSGRTKEQADLFIAGDLLGQIVTSSFTARTLNIPFIGVYGACSTSMEGLALAALMVSGKNARVVLTGTASHNSAAEKLYRYPTEYGAQKPPTAQWTVTGAGAAVIAAQGRGPRVTSATLGRVVDMGLKDPFNMGAAMAPAALDTLLRHLGDMNRSLEDYDLIVTGDLGRVGRAILLDLLEREGVKVRPEQFQDCGILIYGDDPQVMAGGSGAACSAVVTYGHLLKEIESGGLQRILVLATGALLSPLSFQQGESIPCIAHAVAIERPAGPEAGTEAETGVET